MTDKTVVENRHVNAAHDWYADECRLPLAELLARTEAETTAQLRQQLEVAQGNIKTLATATIQSYEDKLAKLSRRVISLEESCLRYQKECDRLELLLAAAQAHEQAAVEAAMREAAGKLSTIGDDLTASRSYNLALKDASGWILALIPTSSGALDRAIAEARQRVADEYEGVHKLIEDVRLLTVDSWPQTHSNPPDVEKWRTIVACLIKCDREVIRALESSAKGETK